jgi:hypothetical protein
LTRSRLSRFAALASAVALASCVDAPAPIVATKLTLVTPPSASVRNRVALATPPRVQLTDESGRAASTSGIAVTATVLTPGATTAGTTTATTNAFGIATFSGLAIAGVAALHEIEFSAPSLGSVTASVTTTPGIAVNIAIISGNDQSALISSPVVVPPSVKVTDADGNAVAGFAVTFSVAAGGGTLSGASQTTDVNGIATLNRWTLGSSAGTNRLVATGAGLSPATFTATANPPAFDIELVYLTSVTQAQRDAFSAAATKWRRVITGDIGSVNVQTTANDCTPAINAVVNDLRIYVTIEPIDGSGRVLGSAGPCFIRSGSKLPVVGAMRFDSADLAFLENNGRLTDVILHEMGHVLGIGTLWETKSLLLGAGGSDPHFVGSESIARFNSIGGSSYVGNKVPVENSGGSGTADGHWRESVFENELMTGFLDAGSNPMSVITIGSLKDLGYSVNFSEANSYSWSSGATLRAPGAPKIHMVGDVLRFTPRKL